MAGTAATVSAFAGFRSGEAAPQQQRETPFHAQSVRDHARQLALNPYKDTDRRLPSELANLSYDQYRGIRFRPISRCGAARICRFRFSYFTGDSSSRNEAAADLGAWDRDLLEYSPGQPRKVRTPDAERLKDSLAVFDGTVEREDGASKGRYRLVIDDVEAEMTYSRAGDGLIIIDHTEVPAALRGRKVGERLARQAIEDARRDGVAIIPLCPFAKAQIGRRPEWQDVLRRS